MIGRVAPYCCVEVIRIARELQGCRELSSGCQAPVVTADISAILWIRIAVIERYPRERDEDLGTRRT